MISVAYEKNIKASKIRGKKRKKLSKRERGNTYSPQPEVSE